MKIHVARMRERHKERRKIAAEAREYETAGDRAMAQFAYIEAGAQFERALGAIHASNPIEDEVRICEKIGRSLFFGARPDLGTAWFERALAGCGKNVSFEKKRIDLMLQLPRQYWLESRTPDALSLAEEAQQEIRVLGDADLFDRASSIAANYYVLLGRYEEALAQFQHRQPFVIRKDTLELPSVRVLRFNEQGIIDAVRGDAEAAFTHFDEAAQAAKQLPDGYFLTLVWDDYANWATILGRIDIARACRERALLVARERRIAWRIPYFTLRFASLLVTLGEYAHARELVVDAMTYDTQTPVIELLLSTVGVDLARILKDETFLNRVLGKNALENAFRSKEPQRIAPVVAALAKIEIARGNRRSAQRLIARGLAAIHHADQAGDLLAIAAQYAAPGEALHARNVLLQRLRSPNHRTARAYLALWEAYDARRHKALGETQVHAERAARLFARLGWRCQQDEALALAEKRGKNVAEAVRPKPAILNDPALGLTDREQEVAELVLRGSTNRAIAQALEISEHTVETHMTSILNRLGLRSRWQLRDLA